MSLAVQRRRGASPVRWQVVALAGLLALTCGTSLATAATADSVGTIGGEPVVQIAAGAFHSCARVRSGGVWCWGLNDGGQLGNGTLSDSTVPVQVPGLTRVAQISVGDDFSCALRSTGRAFCWGWNDHGQLGSGTTRRSLLPVRVLGLMDATGIAAGGAHACALRATGRVVCWGWNGAGQLGNGGFASSATPVRVIGARASGVVQIGAGRDFSCVLRRTGRVFCWGTNAFGELGDGGQDASPVPVAVVGLSAVTDLSVGAFHSCAARANGRVWCWGDNRHGALGIGSTAARRVPGPARKLVDAVAVAAGGDNGSSCAIRANGRTLCWGSNLFGQLGIGNDTDALRRVPVRLPGMDGATQVSIGGHHSCAVRQDGSAWCWGWNANGQLGDGGTVDRAAPVRVRN